MHMEVSCVCSKICFKLSVSHIHVAISSLEGQRRYSETYQHQNPLHYAIVTDEKRIQVNRHSVLTVERVPARNWGILQYCVSNIILFHSACILPPLTYTVIQSLFQYRLVVKKIFTFASFIWMQIYCHEFEGSVHTVLCWFVTVVWCKSGVE